MRIAVVAHGLSNGGAERVASFVANHYARRGHNVLFVAVYSPERVYALDDAVDYVYIGESYTNKLAKGIVRTFQIDRAIRAFRSDIVVSFIINEMILSSVRKTTPIIYSLRIDPAQEFDTPVYKALGFFPTVELQEPFSRHRAPRISSRSQSEGKAL